MEVAWRTDRRPELVYVNRFRVPRYPDVHLLGARYELDDALIGGDSLGEGHFVEYFVAVQRSEGYSLQRLLQTRSVTYSDGDEKGDYLPAAAVSDQARLSLHAAPDWKASEAVWPTIGNDPMLFVGQIDLSETEITRRFLTWDVSVFLFMSRHEPARFKVVEQHGFQAADEHYRNEGD